jgi:hypothetical protein
MDEARAAHVHLELAALSRITRSERPSNNVKDQILANR